MVLTLSPRQQDVALGIGQNLWPHFIEQQAEAEIAHTWLRGENDAPSIPQNQLPDYRELQAASPTNWARLGISIMSQNLYVEGLDRGLASEKGGSQLWKKIWQPNRMDARQISVHRAALGYGVAYVVAEKATMPLTGEPTIKLRAVSPMRGVALWRDPVNDEFPEYFMELVEETNLPNGGVHYVIDIWDERAKHRMEYAYETDIKREQGRGDWAYINSEAHGSSVPPVVRFTNDLDLEGNVTGEVVPFIPLFKRIDQDTFDRLIVQRFGSWKIRTIAGMKNPETEAERELLARILRVNDLLVSDNPDTRFGTLDATDLDGFIKARDADIRDYSAVAQIPPHHLLGLSPNVSAEGLVEAQRGLMQKINERRHLFGESWELVMRLSAHMLGMKNEAADFEAQVRWEDTEGRSLAQVADAIGKLAQMAGLPTEMLWTRYLPNWTQQDTERALALIEEAESEELAMQAALAEGAYEGGAARGGANADDAERRRINRIRGGHGPDWDADGKPN